MNELHEHIVIKSGSDALKESEQRLKAVFGGLKLSDSQEHNLLVAVSEAVNNAVSHGNKNDPEKKVTLDLDYKDGEIVVTVEDEGGGFNPDKLPDPLAPENLLKPSGRGIHIMRSLMDKVDFAFTRQGTKTTLRMKVEATE